MLFRHRQSVCARVFVNSLIALVSLVSGALTRAADSKPTAQNEFLRVTADDSKGGFSIGTLSASQPFVRGHLEGASGEAKTQTIHDATFGDGKSLEWAAGKIVVFPKLPFALVRGTLKNAESETKLIRQAPVVACQVELNRPANKLKTLGTGGLLSPDNNPGSYTLLAVADPASRNSMVAGWLTQERASGMLFSEVADNAVTLKARSDYGNLRLAPGASTETETLAIGYFDDGRLGLEAYADAVAKQYQIKLPPQPSGFCTWYAEKPYGGASNEKNLAVLNEFVAKTLKPFGFDFVQIDDGWQLGEKKNGPKKNFTDFNTAGPYKSGMKTVADEIKSHGLRPGIWFMPFAGTYNDPWFTKQDWFVKRADGKPYDVAWGGTSLDTTNPEVRDYIRSIVHKIGKDWGFTYFKIDGLYTGMAVNPRYPNSGYKDDDFGDAVFSNPDKTNVEVYRDGLKLVREAAGPEVFILGCNTAQNMRTLGASFGLMEGMRIGPDNKGSWAGWAARSPVSGSRFYFLNGRVWYNDPDPNYVRSTIELEDARTIASWSAISGQLNSNSDWIPDLPADRIEMLKRTMLSHGKTARPVDFFEHDPPRIWVVTDEKSQPRRDVVALFNFSDEEQTIDAPIERLGLPQAKNYAAFDFWAGKLLFPKQTDLSAQLPKHGCQTLAVRPLLDRPFLISTSRHITQGMVDVSDEQWQSEAAGLAGNLTGRSKVVGDDPYELRVVADGGEAQQWKLVRAQLSPEDNAAGTTVKTNQSGPDVRVTINSPTDRTVSWKLVFNSAKRMDK